LGVASPRATAARPSDRLALLLVLLAYVLVAFTIFASVWTNPAYLSIGLSGDPQMFMWSLSWTSYALTHHLHPFFTDYLNYPDGANLLWSAIPTVPAVLLSPAMALWGPVVTYNLLMTLGLAASAWCAYIAFNSLIQDRLGAFLGGLLYGFSPYMLAHSLGHPNFVVCFFPPLTLLLLVEIFVKQRRPTWQPGILLGVLGAAQLLTGNEVLFTSVLIAAAGLAVAAVLRPAGLVKRLAKSVPGVLVAAAVGLVLSAYPLYFQFFGPQHVSGVPRGIETYVTDLQNFVTPTAIMLLAPQWAVQLASKWTGNIAEWNGYVGIPLLALLVFTAVRWRSALVVAWSGLMCLGVAALSMGPHLHIGGQLLHVPLPARLLVGLPLFKQILPGRLMLFFFLPAGLLLAYFVQQVKQPRTTWMRPAGFIAAGLALIALLPEVPWPAAANNVPEFFTSAAVQRIPDGSVALVAPFAGAYSFNTAAGASTTSSAMVWQSEAGMRFRMPEGYVEVPGPGGAALGGRPPASALGDAMQLIQDGVPGPALTQGIRASMDADLTRWRVRTVVVGPMPSEQEMVRFFAALLNQEPELVGGVYVWWNVQPS
jgi:hypothetical protein